MFDVYFLAIQLSVINILIKYSLLRAMNINVFKVFEVQVIV